MAKETVIGASIRSGATFAIGVLIDPYNRFLQPLPFIRDIANPTDTTARNIVKLEFGEKDIIPMSVDPFSVYSELGRMAVVKVGRRPAAVIAEVVGDVILSDKELTKKEIKDQEFFRG